MSALRALVVAGLGLWLSGCATTQVQSTGSAPTQSLCQADGERLSALVLWSPQWRPDQKDVPLREAAAQRGLAQFFAEPRCFSKATLHRADAGAAPSGVSDQEALQLAAASASIPDQVLVIKVKELGPLVKLLSSPKLVEGGTEVVLETRVLDVRTGALIGERNTHWQNGGAFVIKGVQTLDQDMRSALQAAFASGARE
jgi:hypothetical protein